MSAAILLAAALTAWLPTHSLTPGATNPAVTQSNIKTTICKPDYTKTIRPPEDVTEALKKKQLTQKRYTDKNPADYEEDHLVSLEIGGSPTGPKNLWPEPYKGVCNAHIKDKLEDKLHTLVCHGKITLTTAQHAIATDWVSAYNKYVGKLSCQ